MAQHNPRFYVDTSVSPRLTTQYAGYSVRAGDSARTGLWLKVGGFSGAVVGLATGQAEAQALPDLPSGGTSTQFLLMKAETLTTTPQSHTVQVWRGKPGRGTVLCERGFTYSGVHDTIKALANKVQSVTANVPTSAASIGDSVTVTVEGDTGTLGAGPAADPGVLNYTPAALEGFPAGAWRLERTELKIPPPGGTVPDTHVDRLYLTGASGAARKYTATYVFRAIGPTDVEAPVKPIQYIASGTQVKHTDVGGTTLYSLPQVSPIAKTVLEKRLVSPPSGVLPPSGGIAAYELLLRNTATVAAVVDVVTDTLPVGGTYVADSLHQDLRLIAPRLTGQVLTIDGPVRVPALGTTRFTYSVSYGASPGLKRNAAVAEFGQVVIDATADVGSAQPAVSDVTVLSATGLVAVADAKETEAATPVRFAPLANDSSPSGLPLSMVSVGLPDAGQVLLHGDGEVTYSPPQGRSGTFAFTYVMTDGHSQATGQVSVTVRPAAANDAYATPVGVTLTGPSVLANDVCSGCSVAVSEPIVRQGGGATGTLTMSTDGSFTFVPPSGASGTFTFGYAATANGRSASATVTIMVTNLGPDQASTPHAAAVVLDVKKNDVCSGGCNPAAGTVAPTLGSALYRSSSKDLQYTPRLGSWGVDTFNYRVGGNNSTELAPVTVLVGPDTTRLSTTYGQAVVQAPAGQLDCSGCAFEIASPPSQGTAAIDAATAQLTYVPGPTAAGQDTFGFTTRHPATGLAIDGTVHVTIGPRAVADAAPGLIGEPLELDVAGNDTCPATCTWTLLTGPTGAALSPDGKLTWTPSVVGTTPLTYQVASTVAGSASSVGTVTITVQGVRDDAVTTVAGTPVILDVRANDPCTSCSWAGLTQPAAGSATGSDSAVTYTPDPGFSGTDTFTYSLSSGSATTTGTVVVTVRPLGVYDSAVTLVGRAVELRVLDNDLCGSCSVTAVGPASSGAASVLPGGQLVRFEPAAVGAATFTYDLADRTGGTSTATVSVEVVAPPTPQPDTASTVAGLAVLVPVLANDGCPGCVVDVDTDPATGSASLDASGGLRYAPAPGRTGRVVFRYLLTDPGTGGSASAQVTVDVGPTAAGDTAWTPVGAPVDVRVLDNDVCIDCTRSVVSTTGPGTAAFVDGRLQVVPTGGQTGVVTVEYLLTEVTTGQTATATVIVDVNDARPDSITTPYGVPVTVDVLANDACEGCAITRVDGAGTHDGDKHVTVPADTAGLVVATYTAGIADGKTVSSTLRVLVAPPNRTSTLEPGAVLTGSVHDATAGPTTPATTCPGCTARLVRAPAAGEIELGEDGALAYWSADGWTGSESFTYSLTDPVSGLSVEAVHTVVVATTAPSVALSSTAGEIVRSGSGPVMAGDTVPLSHVVRNTGSDGLEGVAVTADRGSAVDCAPGTLAPSLTRTCTSSLPLTQADVDAGTVTVVTAVSATGGGQTVTDTSGVTVTVPRTSSLSATATAVLVPDVVEPDDAADPGDHVTATWTVTNTGNTTLTSPSVDGTACEATTVAPGGSTSCVRTVTLTEDHVQAGELALPGVITATSPTGVVTLTVPTTTALPGTSTLAALTLTTTLAATGGAAGDTVTVTHVVKNIGDVAVTGLVVQDDLMDGVACSPTDLDPGSSATCSGNRLLTDAEAAAGKVVSRAIASASASGGRTPTANGSAELALPVVLTGKVTLVATAVVDPTVVAPAGRVDAGDRVTVAYTATNDGTAPLSGLVVTDAVAGAVTCADSVLAAGVSTACTGSVVLTQTQVDDGTLAGTATATGSAAASSVSASSPWTADLPASPALGFVKSVVAGAASAASCGSAGGSATVAAGATASFCFALTNTGNTTLTSPVVVDPALGLGRDGAAASIVSGSPALAPGGTLLLAAPAPSGGLVNTARAEATPPSGTPVASADDTATLVVSAPAAGEVKGVVWFDRNSDRVFGAGEWPLPGVTVTLAPRTTSALRSELHIAASSALQQVTGPDGSYAFTGVAPGDYRVSAAVDLRGFEPTWNTGGTSTWMVDVVVAPAGVTQGDFAGLGKGALGGQVFEAGSAEAVPGASVSCTWAGYDDVLGTADDVVMAQAADASGRFALDGVPYGHFSCVGQDVAGGRTSPVSAVEVMSAESVQVLLPLLRPGQVLPDPSAATPSPAPSPVTGEDPAVPAPGPESASPTGPGSPSGAGPFGPGPTSRTGPGDAVRPAAGLSSRVRSTNGPHSVAGTPLPRTGADPGGLLTLSAGLLLAGVALVSGGRRRRAA